MIDDRYPRGSETMTKGYLIIGYGTRKGNLEQVLESQAARLRARGRKNIYIAYFRVSSPTIQEAVAQMVADGIDDILAFPYLIADGKLTYELMPEKLGIRGQFGSVNVGGKNVMIRFLPPFGTTPVLSDILCDRVAEAGGSSDSGILIVGHGSRDSALSNLEIIELNHKRMESRGYRHVAHGFNEFCKPTIDEAVVKLIDEGVKEIIVTPLFIAMGLHLNSEIPEQIGIPEYSSEGVATRNGRSVPVKYMRPVEDDPRLLEIMDAQVANFYGE